MNATERPQLCATDDTDGHHENHSMTSPSAATTSRVSHEWYASGVTQHMTDTNSTDNSFFSCVDSEDMNGLTARQMDVSTDPLLTSMAETDESCLDWSQCNQTDDSLAIRRDTQSPTQQTIDKRFNDFMDLLNKSKHFSVVMENNLRQQRQELIQCQDTTPSPQPIGFNHHNLKSDSSSAGPLNPINSLTQTNGTDEATPRKSLRLQGVCKIRLNDDSNDIESDADTSDTRSSSSSYENKGVAVDSRQPYLVSGTVMRDYQLEGLEWMRLLIANNTNGILADEMGLGKTIQAIAIISHIIESNHKDPFVGPFLVIAPLTTLHNWKLEFTRFAPLVPAFVLHGNQKERKLLYPQIAKAANIHFGLPMKRRKCYPVVITSYEVFKRCIGVMKKHKWMYVVVDEGHKLKNINCQLSRILRQISSKNRVILTGTPLHNTLAELWALLNYVSPEIFNDWKIFEDLLTTNSSNQQIIEQEKQNKIISSIHQILAPFMLRRTKPEVGLDLPPKKEILVYAPSTPSQQILYECAVNLVKSAKEQKSDKFTLECSVIDGRKRRKSTKIIDYKQYYKDFDELYDEESYTSLIADESVIELPKELVGSRQDNQYVSFGRFNRYNILMQMRKITNHPYLVQWPYDHRKGRLVVNEDIVRTSGKMRALDELLQQLYVRKNRVILFSQMTKMLDVIEEYCHYRKYQFLRFDGSTKLDERQQYINEFNTNDQIFMFLVSTRAGGLGINLCGADTAIIYDSDWNPQMDLQAQDRCHRIGQSKPVIVYRLVTAHTIDEKILQTANSKRKLDKMIIQKGQSFRASNQQNGDQQRTLTLDELIKILESTDFKAIYNYSTDKLESDRLYSDEDLKKMLDRECSEELIEIGSQFNRSQE